MKKNDGQGRATTILFCLFFLGLVVTIFALVDLHWTHRVLVKEQPPTHARQERP